MGFQNRSPIFIPSHHSWLKCHEVKVSANVHIVGIRSPALLAFYKALSWGTKPILPAHWSLLIARHHQGSQSFLPWSVPGVPHKSKIVISTAQRHQQLITLSGGGDSNHNDGRGGGGSTLHSFSIFKLPVAAYTLWPFPVETRNQLCLLPSPLSGPCFQPTVWKGFCAFPNYPHVEECQVHHTHVWKGANPNTCPSISSAGTCKMCYMLLLE